MLLRMSSEQVSRQWDFILHTIRECVPHTLSEYDAVALLEEFMSGQMVCWIFALDEGDDNFGVVTTRTSSDHLDKRVLTIYSIYSHGTVPLSVWKDGFAGVYKWAVSDGHDYCLAYSNNKVSNKLLEVFGGVLVMYMYTLDLKKEE